MATKLVVLLKEPSLEMPVTVPVRIGKAQTVSAGAYGAKGNDPVPSRLLALSGVALSCTVLPVRPASEPAVVDGDLALKQCLEQPHPRAVCEQANALHPQAPHRLVVLAVAALDALNVSPTCHRFRFVARNPLTSRWCTRRSQRLRRVYPELRWWTTTGQLREFVKRHTFLAPPRPFATSIHAFAGV